MNSVKSSEPISRGVQSKAVSQFLDELGRKGRKFGPGIQEIPVTPAGNPLRCLLSYGDRVGFWPKVCFNSVSSLWPKSVSNSVFPFVCSIDWCVVRGLVADLPPQGITMNSESSSSASRSPYKLSPRIYKLRSYQLQPRDLHPCDTLVEIARLLCRYEDAQTSASIATCTAVCILICSCKVICGMHDTLDIRADGCTPVHSRCCCSSIVCKYVCVCTCERACVNIFTCVVVRVRGAVCLKRFSRLSYPCSFPKSLVDPCQSF